MQKTSSFSLDILALWVTVIFLTLQSCGIICWPWWLILMPLFVAVAFTIVVFAIVGAAAASILKDRLKDDEGI